MSQRVEIPPRDTEAPVRIPHRRTNPSEPKKRGSGVFHERHTSAQDDLYRDWMQKGLTLTFTFDDGSIMTGVLTGYDTYALSVADANEIPILVFKQSLRMIAPS